MPRSLALCMFGTPDFADKFPTQQEKLLACFERIEIGYFRSAVSGLFSCSSNM